MVEKKAEENEEEEEAQKKKQWVIIMSVHLGSYKYFRCFVRICSINLMGNWFRSTKETLKNEHPVRNNANDN